MSIFESRLKYVNAQTWDTTARPFPFPEWSDADINRRRDCGVAFSGGGTRSASATVGQLRALNQLGLLQKIGYISCVSGGSWTSVPFTYLPAPWSDETFLGPVLAPGEITPEHLEQTDRNSFAHAIANSVLLDDFLKHAIRLAGDETYARSIGDCFLTPFQIDSLKRFFGYDQAWVGGILTRNEKMLATDFYLVRSGRPYLIAGGLILRVNNQPPQPKRVPFEMTPRYVGSYQPHPQSGSDKRDIGVCYVEPFGFDSDGPEKKPDAQGVANVRLGAGQYRFTLSDVVGTAGAAPAEVLARIGLDWIGFPEFKYWTTLNGKTLNRRAKEYEFGDAGILENLGVMPLLIRKVKRIVVFINTNDPVISETQINNSLPPLFGQTPDFMDNHVFDPAKYGPLVQALLAAKSDGRPVVHRDMYRVRQNDLYGVEGGWDVDILWVYNERVRDWEGQLRSEVRERIGRGSLANFPHYLTFLQNPPAIIDLSATQVSLLSHLACWVTLNQEAKLRQMFP